MKDIFGQALLDYFHGDYSEDIITETNISEKDVLPLPYLFRSYSEMPEIEQQALNLASGKILDVGCGAGNHSIYLEEKGLQVKSIDVSPGAIEVCKLRGVKDCSVSDILELTEMEFDTILMLMNGTGIFGKLENVPRYLNHLANLLSPHGQILIDSSDLRYMYDTTESGAIIVPADKYYGELDYQIHYKGYSSEVFPLLYLGKGIFEDLCNQQGLKFEVVQHGENYDYLARITAG